MNILPLFYKVVRPFPDPAQVGATSTGLPFIEVLVAPATRYVNSLTRNCSS
jgi:hypothetical protein